VPFGEVLIVGSSSGYLYGLDLQTGKQRWSFLAGYGVTAELGEKRRGNSALHAHQLRKSLLPQTEFSDR
jgi:outer membrane protein assembly factor BamB